MSEFTRLRAAILALDIRLTNDERMARHNDGQRTNDRLREFATDMGNGMVYLADGGYSRVFIHFDGEDKPRLAMSTESTDRTKAAFTGATDERKEVEDAVEELWAQWLDPQPATN